MRFRRRRFSARGGFRRGRRSFSRPFRSRSRRRPTRGRRVFVVGQRM